MQDIAACPPIPIAISQPSQPLQSVIESGVDEEPEDEAQRCALNGVRSRTRACVDLTKVDRELRENACAASLKTLVLRL